MTFHFDIRPDAHSTEIRLVGPGGAVPFDRWALDAPEARLPGVELAQRLIASESAIATDDVLLVNSETIAGLTAAEAARLDLPPLAEVVAKLVASGLISQPNYRLDLDWTRPTGQPLVGGERVGPWLKIGSRLHRLPDVLYAIAEAVETVNAAGQRVEDKLIALSALREALPAGAEQGLAHASGLVGRINIAIADSFSLDLRGDGGYLAPVLHSGGAEAPLLEPAQQEAFERSFNSAPTSRSVYSLSGQWYVVPQAPLRRALTVVRRINSASASIRRAFLANPRTFLREELGDDAELVALESVFRETQAYADRVLGLGLWQPRVVPWIPLPTTDWLGVDSKGSKPLQKPPGLMIGDRHLPLDPQKARELSRTVEQAIASGNPSVEAPTSNDTIDVPATKETLEALANLASARRPLKVTKKEGDPKADPVVLLIKSNETELEIEDEVRPLRSAPVYGSPTTLATKLKPHQEEGLRWLQQAWTSGLPGVLLADDMGLGKTLQGLAFLAWLRDGMLCGSVRRSPILVVAPTGLLKNWRAEHDRHLGGDGLGRCTEAFGRGLATLKRPNAQGQPSLDEAALAKADWVLTTYETLRDYDRDFGKIGFAAALFDEAQKIKTPGVRITDAAKAIAAKCDFRVAITGTPVENRLADLWCIMDGVHPGLLDDLKTFSERYERALDATSLGQLKRTLDTPMGGRPQIMLRRLKEDRLPELPEVVLRSVKRPMPLAQREVYQAAVAAARGADRPGAMLEVLQKLRAISLHPNPTEPQADDAFIAASARLSVAFETLDVISAAGEKVLLFLEDLDLQAKLGGLLQRRYRMSSSPALINGTVDGGKRQSRVDAFQNSPDGFDAMILSPRAGGVGLTLTRANHVLHLSRWWNPAVEDQCNGRVHRIGQTRPVVVYLPLATLDDASRTFDENLDALLARKRKLMHETLMPPEARSEQDRDELFRATVGQTPST